jgi:hypothetical protein
MIRIWSRPRRLRLVHELGPAEQVVPPGLPIQPQQPNSVQPSPNEPITTPPAEPAAPTEKIPAAPTTPVNPATHSGPVAPKQERAIDLAAALEAAAAQ